VGLAAICDFEWALALGGERLTAAEFRALAALKTPLVRLRGQWIELRAGEVEEALRLLERDGSTGTMTAMEALRLSAGATGGPAGLPVLEVTAEPGSWLAGVLNGDHTPEPVRLPPGFRAVLRPYQERGLSWLAFLDRLGLGACLADDMGLGKTVQLLALLAAERAGDARPAATLLVCPMSVVGNWQREAERFAPDLRVHVHHGGGRLSGEAFAASVRDDDLVITTYGLAARDRDLLATVEWHRLALDEAQNIKNSDSQQHRAIRSIPARGRVALTGTPVENRLSELRSLMDFLNPGLLGTPRDFRTRFSIPIERFRDAESAQRLRRITGPFLLRRLKTDPAIVPDLPRKMEMKAFCNLTPEQASLYQAVVDDMLARVEESEGITRKGLVLATMLKLKQVCNHPAHLLQDRSSLAGRSGKLALLEEILDEVIAGGDRALVFTQFVELGGMLQPYLRERLGREIAFLHGGTSRKQRDAMVQRFQGGDGPPVFLLSLKAGGTGLNLTAANQVVHFDRWWNPAVEDQATDRAFRIGQKRNVQVRKLVCAGTVEERIDLMLERKKELAERVVGAGESWLTELSTADLREIVRLSTDAVAEREDR
jgi:SNF2 family DNA or RNA helicase